ncbi:MAG: 4-(cytidine 5'-diphospho)-2-C-methyl-D-erythritol kinase [Cyanobium sp.]
MTFTALAPAKINLHLEVLGLRPDGYHELAMVMQTLDLVDTLRFAPTADGRITLSCDRPELPSGADNLIVRAAELLRARAGLPELGAAIQLQKRIPIGAGLAGGSSDGAAALLGLNSLWGLGFSQEALLDFAADLGSDMPYCLEGGSRLCFGRGERLEALAEAQAEPSWAVLLIKHPDVSVSTPWAYGRCRAMRSDFYLSSEEDFEQRRQSLRQGPLAQALRAAGPLPPLRNDLQAVVAPEVESVPLGLQLLRGAGQPLAVAMSGSGPSLFALHRDLQAADAARRQLQSDLEAAGFESWCCGFRQHGVTLEAAANPA